MRKPALSVVCFGLATFLFARPCLSGDRIAGNFGARDLSGWTPKAFKGETSYSFVQVDGRTVLKAHSRAAASGLYKKIDLDPRAYSVLRWSWKIEQANSLAVGASVPNAYASNSIMVAVESGNGKAGKWVNEERNVYDDYRKLFAEEPPHLGAVALMTDTDNTGEEAVAWYGDITLVTQEASR